MSKRKCDEFRDPDYDECVKIKTEPLELTAEEKLEKIKCIIRKEFLNELTQKHETLELIDERLLEARKIFHRLRYAIVNNFYNTKKFELTDSDIHKEVAIQSNPVVKSEVYTLLTNDQKRLHPTVKHVLANNENEDMKLSPYRPQRKKSKHTNSSQNVTTIVDSNIDTLRTIKVETNNFAHKLSSDQSNHADKDSLDRNNHITIPMYVEPKISEDNVLKFDSGRTKQKQKFRIIIGNTSKYVEPHSSHDRVTHRWLLYVRGPPSSPDISHILEYVTVQLHDSYIPHNIIKIRSPPFHLSRRGWGEFPVKLRLHFKNEQLNKPINIVHSLKLDRLHTGLQTLGGETVVDVWLYASDAFGTNISTSGVDDSIFIVGEEKCDDTKNFNDEICENIKKEREDVENNLFENEFKIKDEPMDIDDENIETYNAFSDLEHLNELHNQLFDIKNSDDKICDKIFTSENLLKTDAKFSKQKFQILKPNDIQKLYNDNGTLMDTIFNDHNYCLNISSDITSNTNLVYSDIETTVITKLHKVVGLHQIVKWFNSFELEFNKMLNINKIIEMNKSIIDKISISNKIDHNKMLNIENITTMNKIIISSYIKELSSLIWKNKKGDREGVKKVVDVLQNIHLINDTYFNMKQTSNTKSLLKTDFNLDRDKSNSIAKALGVVDGLIRDMPKVVDVRCFVNLMLKRMPIIDKSANHVEFQQLFPFTVKNYDSFFSMNVIKRRNLQWTRAKMIRCFLEKIFGTTSIWTTKQILVFSQYHGYYPVKEENNDFTDNPRIPNDKSDLKETFEKPSEINTKTLCVYNVDKFETKTDEISNNNDLISYTSSTNDFCYISDSSDDEIDICNDKEDFCKRKKLSEETNNKLPLNKMILEFLPFENNHEKMQCKYIENECSKVGVELRNQNIGHGFVHGAAHKMILVSVKCLIEDILRRALSVKLSAINNSINHVEESSKSDVNNMDTEEFFEFKFQEYIGNKKDVEFKATDLAVGGKIWKMSESATVNTVSLRHIFEGLKTRKEFDILTNSGLGLEPSEFQGEL